MLLLWLKVILDKLMSAVSAIERMLSFFPLIEKPVIEYQLNCRFCGYSASVKVYQNDVRGALTSFTYFEEDHQCKCDHKPQILTIRG